jgi:hypothetical protein
MASCAVPGITVAASVAPPALLASVIVFRSRVAPLPISVAVASAAESLSVDISVFLFSVEFVSCGVVDVDFFAMVLTLFWACSALAGDLLKARRVTG